MQRAADSAIIARMRPTHLLALVASFATAFVACSSSDSAPAETTPPRVVDPAKAEARMTTTLHELASLGFKRVGSSEGAAAGDYVSQRFTQAGLADVHFEPFSFPKYDVVSSSLAATVEGAAVAMAHDVFSQSGKGHVDADVVYVGKGHEKDYEGKDVTGKVVLLDRDPTFHRSSQFRLVHAHGGAAMLYVSQAPDDLVQIGTVADPEDGLGPIPAVTVGKDDGTKLETAALAGKAVRAVIDVDAKVSPATGRNVVGRLAGATPDAPYVLVGAHYDTWQIGSADNGTGVAALLEVAERLAAGAPRKLGVVFVGYDGEEPGLFGGYDYLRKHVVVGAEPMLAWVNFEIPGAGTDGIRAMAHTSGSPVDPAIVASETSKGYTLYVGMEAVPQLFGGVIPTDIQGMYWYGLQGVSTACDTPWYHTVEDTPEKIDTAFLAKTAGNFVAALEALDGADPSAFTTRDPHLWTLEAKTSADAAGLAVDVVAATAKKVPAAGADVRVWVDVDDFTRAFVTGVTADADGKAHVVVPASALGAGAGGRWLHVTAGDAYPSAEQIVALP